MNRVKPAVVSERAEKLAEILASQQGLIDEGRRILKSMCHRYDAVRVAYEPVRVQSLDLTNSQTNADRLKDAVAMLLERLKAAEKLSHLLQDPELESNLPQFLSQLRVAEEAMHFFQSTSGLDVFMGAINDLKEVTAHAYQKCAQIATRLRRAATRTPTKPALESILALPISERPSASDVYVVADSTAMQDASRLMAALVSAGEPDCISTFCQERQNHMVTLMQTMGAELDGFAANIGPSPQDRRVDKWSQAIKLLAQLIEWEGQVVHLLIPGPHEVGALTSIIQPTFDVLIAQGMETARTPGQPEKIFKVLQMLACLTGEDVAPLFLKALAPPELAPFSAKLRKLVSQLNAEGRSLTQAFTDAVASDVSVLALKDHAGATSVAPQTAFAMRFLKNVFKEEVAAQLTFLDSPSGFAYRTITDLQSNLEAKVQSSVKDKAAVAIIMLNNVNYVRVCIEEHTLLNRELGESWLAQQNQTIKRWKNDYLARVWSPLITDSEAAAAEASPQMKKDTMKEHFKKINTKLEKVLEQAVWSMHDTSLRSHVRRHILVAFLPTYSDVWEKYQRFNLVKNPYKYFKYSPAELQEFINNELFSAKAPRKQGTVPKALMRLAIDMNANAL